MPKTDKKLKSLKEAVSEKIDTSFQIKVTKMPVKIIERFRQKCKSITDTRAAWDIEYSLESIIIMVFIAVLGGCDTWVDIEQFCRAKKEWLKKFVELPNDSTPCNDTFSRVFHNIDQKEFHKLTVDFVTDNLSRIKRGLGIPNLNPVKHFAIDGKQERGTGRLAGTAEEIRDQQTLHIYETTEGVCVMSKRIDTKTNEIPVAQELLSAMESLEGVIVSGDALHTQIPHTVIITEKGGDYVFGLKGNQSALKNEVEFLFTEEKIKELKANPETSFSVTEKSHSQIEIREYLMITDTTLPSAENRKWANLNSYMLVIKTCTNTTTGETVTEKRYYIGSLKDIELFATIIRSHWGCEIHHFFLDYVYHQDFNQTVDENAFQNLAAVKKMTLTLIRIYSVLENLSVTLTRKRIGWDPETEIASILSFYDEETLKNALEASASAPAKPKRSRIKVKAYRAQLEAANQN